MNDIYAILVHCRELGAELTPTPHGTLKVSSSVPLPDTLWDELKRRKREILILLGQQNLSSYRVHYCRAAESLREDCFAIDVHWLIDQHPEIWKHLCFLDGQASWMEKQNNREDEYRKVLKDIARAVKRAQELFKAEKKAVEQ